MKIQKHFTLIELLVSMGLLTLLVMLMLQLFGGAQRLWLASDRRNAVNSDARAALELMSDLIGTVQYSRGEKADGTHDPDTDVLFSVDRDAAGDHKVYFVTKTSLALAGQNGGIFFVSFQLGDGTNGESGKLYMTVCSERGSASGSGNAKDNFDQLFAPYNLEISGRTTIKNRGEALSAAKSLLKPVKKENDHCQVIAENVVRFDLNVYAIESKVLKKKSVSEWKEPPYMLEMLLTVLSRDDYEKYRELDGEARKKFLDKCKQTFTRSVFIGSRWALQKD